MAEPDLTFLSAQVQQVLDELRAQRAVLRQLDIRIARVETTLTHLDSLMTAILDELRAIRTQTAHMSERITELESR